VDLAAERDPDGAVLVRHRLMAVVGEVDDREPPVTERDALLRRVPGAAVVGAAVDEALAHRRHELFVDGEALPGAEDAADPAHQSSTVAPDEIDSRAASATRWAR